MSEHPLCIRAPETSATGAGLVRTTVLRMKFSVWPSFGRPWSEVVELATFAETAGWHGFWYADHLMPNTEDGTPDDGDALECWTVLAALAPLTQRLRLGSLVSPVTLHHPIVLAKRATTVDQISNGRAVLGLGAGWQVNEHACAGIELPTPGVRVGRFADAIEMVARVLVEQRVTTDGAWFRATDLPFQPKPVQAQLPVMVGTGSPRMSRLTARWAQEWNTWGDPTEVRRRSDIFDAACELEQRDPASVYRSVQGLIFHTDDPAKAAKLRERAPEDRALIGSTAQLIDLIGSYAEMGVDEFIVPDFTLGNTHKERMDAYAMIDEHIVSALR
jgi:alkanesulfonate monooxygenase SsuD/methylene tetrahydromethanopterin reductase-like flavin-dependent oxidoreductase (luciferase family)